MLEVSKPARPDPDDRKVIVVELVAASSVFLIILFVLYLVFTYRPA